MDEMKDGWVIDDECVHHPSRVRRGFSTQQQHLSNAPISIVLQSFHSKIEFHPFKKPYPEPMHMTL